MKKIVIALMMLCTFGAYAANENAATSKEYVDTELATKQPTIPAEGNNVVITFDSTADDGIGTKEIYDESASYAEQTDALVTAGTANAAVQMAINGEFECVLYDPDNPTDCWWWNIKSANQQRLPAGYTELEYITFDGNSYIDTGVVLTDAKYIENVMNIKAQIISEFQTITGFMPSADTYIPRYGINIYTGKWMIGINRTVMSENNADTNKHKLKFVTSDSTQTLNDSDNILITIPILGSLSNNTLSLYLGARHNLSGVQNYFIGDIGLSYLKQNGVMLYDYIPCLRDSDNVVGFYDTVSQTFKTNGGNGTLTAGPVASYLPQNQQ